MKKKIIIGILVAALIAGSGAGGAVYYKHSHQKTVSVVSVDSLAGQYYLDDTNLSGNITTSAVQNVMVDKDMIIQEVYVNQGDSVQEGDKLISFDMTLVQMELNIAKLKQQQQEQDLNKAVNRLNSLKNGGPIEESDETESDTGWDTDTSSGLDEYAGVSGSVSGVYLAAVMNPILAAAVTEVDENAAVEAQQVEGDVSNDGSSEASNTENGSGDASSDDSTEDVIVDFESGDGEGNTPTGTPTPEEDPEVPDISEEDQTGTNTGEVEIIDTEPDDVKEDFTDGNPMFYQVLDGDIEPFEGSGTEEDPYVFLCSGAKGYVIVKGSFLNKMAGFHADGTKDFEQNGYWYQLEFHQNDTITNFMDRKESCIGYYLVDGSLLESMVPDTSEVEFSLEGASQYEQEPDDGYGSDGDYDGSGDDGSSSLSREDAIKAQQNRIETLKLDIRESKLNIEKLEKKVKNEVVYSKLDGTIANVGDPVTGVSEGSTFMTIKSKEGFYVSGTVSELMLDQVKEGTVLNCSTSTGEFEANVMEVSEYPVSGESYYGSGNPNVSYYSYTATIPDKSVQVSDEDWLSISLTSSEESKGIVLDKAFVRSENGVSYVYKEDNGTLKKQVLTVGGNVNGGYSILVTGGITREDKIAFPYGDAVKEGVRTKEVTLNEFYGY